MAKPPRVADDPRFHRTLFGSLTEFNKEMPPAVIYVENNNFNSGYDMLAYDYKMAVDAMIEEYRKDGLGNWQAPIAYMARQSLELAHKSLLEETGRMGNSVPLQVMFSHSLENIWKHSRDWMLERGYPIENDKRFPATEWLTANFHAVDPAGDLFRFAQSTVAAYSRQKTYDRAGVYVGSLSSYLNDAHGLLAHWGSVLNAQKLRMEDADWEPSAWDPSDYPKIKEIEWTW
ncbi:hypothetical protein [Bradyrhizobium sp. LVM 105]|uniref:hypothetical protein n=1 Tax=Bradyrhizobium sp. LVM 105 TaxID=2341115 RepID=UPI000F7FC127|nr:hypothetical protein [Bradyrhizobium sp. LVM 105]RTE90667.1 hypothetical protein D6B98_24800 [Bradyrhizobium sp. LVM 105]